MSRLAVITSCFGGYDSPPIAPPDVPQITEWVFVTDGEPADGWTTITEDPVGDPRMQAKRPKCLPWEYTKAEKTLWLDASLVPKASVMRNFPKVGMKQHPHIERNDFYDEALASVPNPKYDRYSVLEQADSYLAEGMPRNWGLWCTGLIGRADSSKVRAHGKLWWEEIQKWSTQDQVSHPYACWKLDIRPRRMPGHILHNNSIWYRLHEHELRGVPAV